jgi:hypothetical protein
MKEETISVFGDSALRQDIPTGVRDRERLQILGSRMTAELEEAWLDLKQADIRQASQ